MDSQVATLDDPRQRGHALSGPFGGLWRYRVGSYRIVCDIQGHDFRVLVVRVGHRDRVYRRRAPGCLANQRRPPRVRGSPGAWARTSHSFVRSQRVRGLQRFRILRPMGTWSIPTWTAQASSEDGQICVRKLIFTSPVSRRAAKTPCRAAVTSFRSSRPPPRATQFWIAGWHARASKHAPTTASRRPCKCNRSGPCCRYENTSALNSRS